MFSSSHSIVREKQFLLPRKKTEKNGIQQLDSETMTDNLLLFTAQQARIQASVHAPVGRFRRLFRWMRVK